MEQHGGSLRRLRTRLRSGRVETVDEHGSPGLKRGRVGNSSPRNVRQKVTHPRKISFEGGAMEGKETDAVEGNETEVALEENADIDGLDATKRSITPAKYVDYGAPDNNVVEEKNVASTDPDSTLKHQAKERFGKENLPKEAIEIGTQILRRRFCNMQAAPLLPNAEENRRKLYELLKHTVVEACNNSVLLLGPRGYGKSMVLEHVLKEMQQQHPERVSIVRLNGLLHSDDRSALKEIAKQLCIEHALEITGAASFDENLRFLTIILEEFSHSRRALVVVLDEFDLFTQKPKQSLLYNLLNLLQTPSSQAAVIGISCRLDADQLLEKRVRSRFSQRKLLFLPPSSQEITSFLESILVIPVDPSAPLAHFAEAFNRNITALLQKESTKELVKQLADVELSPRYILDTIFRTVCEFSATVRSSAAAFRRKPTVSSLCDLSVLELCLLTSMKRLEAKERDSYNFNSIFKEYKQLQDTQNTSDSYTKQAAFKAFEHLLERELIAHLDGKSQRTMLSQVRPVKMLVSSDELLEGLESSPICPAILRQWYSREAS